MGLVDFILNLAGVLVWLSWRSIRFDPLVKTTPATLVGTLRRAEPHRRKGWHFLAGLAGLLVLRAVLYRLIGPEVDWTPRLNLFFVALAFKSHLLPLMMTFSVLSFARMLIICYLWLLVLALINRRYVEPNPLQKMLRLHLGAVARWPWPLQLLLPLVLVTVLWMALHPLLVHLEVAGRVQSAVRLAEQGVLIGIALYFSLQFVLPPLLLLHLIASHVYLGKSPVWDFVGATARNMLAPLRGLPLRAARFDFAPLAGVIMILFLLHWLPNLILGRLADNNLNPWPQ